MKRILLLLTIGTALTINSCAPTDTSIGQQAVATDRGQVRVLMIDDRVPEQRPESMFQLIP